MKIRETVIALLAGSMALTSAASGQVTKGGRASTARYFLELSGAPCGFVASVEGGHATSDVVVEKLGVDRIARKHLGPVRYEEISVTAGTGMCKGLYDWVAGSFSSKGERRDGALVTLDFDGKVMSRMEFKSALVTEAGMPTLDAASKEAATMTLKFAPEYTRTKGGDNTKITFNAGIQKKWSPANFRLTLGTGKEHDDATQRIAKIEGIAVKQTAVSSAVGERRDYQKEPSRVEYPNLVITFAESHSASFYKWHEDFVIKGNNGQEKEKTATLEYLTPDLKTVLFTLKFQNVGVFKVAPEKTDAKDQIRRVKAEMYCEKIDFTANTALK